MPDFIAKTHEGRNIIITADRFEINNFGNYVFFTNGNIVASVNGPSVLVVSEFDEAYQADFFNDEPDEDETEDDHDDTCLDCRLEEFTQSPTFFDEVYSIIDFYFSKDNQEPAACPCAETAPAPEPYPIQHWKDKDGDEWYGFWVKGGFVHFSTKASAEFGRGQQIKNTDEPFWSYKDLTGATRLED